MRKLVIKDLGPIRDCEIFLNKFNIIIGPQSSGKSCVLKIASFCTWVEKRIQISQNPDALSSDNFFLNRLVTFHKLQGYIHDNTFISYKSDFMEFSYDNVSRQFSFNWKPNRWTYISPKISYIPSERNMVAAIPNWYEVKMADDNIRNFITDWQRARTSLNKDLNILNLGVAYHYDEVSKSDKVIMNNGNPIDLTNTSSGLQSLVPAAVHLEYLFRSRFMGETEKSVIDQQEYDNLRDAIYKIFPGGIGLLNTRVYENFTSANLTDIFFEEPEQNLFPPTQSSFALQLVEYFRGEHGGCLFIATHSPYLVNSFLEIKDMDDLSLFVINENVDGSYSVSTPSPTTLQEIYDYDVDVFHNLTRIAGN